MTQIMVDNFSNGRTLKKVTESLGLPLWSGSAWPVTSHTHTGVYEPANSNIQAHITNASLDDHTQYAKLSGRAGGQSITGGTAASEGLTLSSTSHATKGKITIGGIVVDQNLSTVGIGVASPLKTLDIVGETSSDRTQIRIANVATDATQKQARIVMSCYTNAEEPILLFGGLANSTDNEMYFGGLVGATAINAATAIKFITAAAINTQGGTMRLLIDKNGNIGIGATAFGTSSATALGMSTGTAPSTSPADMFHLYSADIAAGHAAPHFRTELGRIIKLYQQAHIINADGNLADITTKFNALLVYFENLGMIATS